MIGRPLTNSEFWQQLVAKNTGRNDPLRHRNRLLLLLAGLCGLRESELTLINIGIFVSSTGALREFAVLPDSITRDRYERPILITHPALKEAFEQYIQWLLESGINTQPAAHHLGLDPNAPLLVNDKYVSFSKQRRGEGALSPSAINKCLDTLIWNARLADMGIKRISLLRTAVIEAYRSGMSTTDFMITTGFAPKR